MQHLNVGHDSRLWTENRTKYDSAVSVSKCGDSTAKYAKGLFFTYSFDAIDIRS